MLPSSNQINAIKEHISLKWQDYEALPFDKVKEAMLS